MSGYSGTPLTQKLGIKPEIRSIIINPPEEFPIKPTETKLEGKFDFIHLFAKDKSQLEKIFPKLIYHVNSAGILWISWPKKSSKVESDLNENIIRDIGLKLGVVDIKVAAIDEVWSGLKFMIRRELRKNS